MRILLKTLKACAIVLLIAMIGGFVSSKGIATAATSSTINFQARLQTAAGAIVQDGNYNVEFKIYNASSSSGSSQGTCTGDSNCLWVETRTGANTARVVDGYLTVNLGSVNSFPANMPWDQQLWLTMNIGGTGASPTWDGEMNPRIQLTAIPYAFKAGAALSIQNASYTTLLSTSGNKINLQNATSTSSALMFGGNANADLYSPSSSVIKTDGTLDAAVALQTNDVTRIDSSGNLTNIGNITLANPGIGNPSTITFTKTSDHAWISVDEVANDQTIYGFYMSDNPDSSTDHFLWQINDWKGSGGSWQPLDFSNITANIRASNINAYGDLNVNGPWYSGDGTPGTVDVSKTGTLNLTPDVSGYTGTYAFYWVKIDGAGSPNTFSWGVNTSDSTGAASATNVPITGSSQALSSGVNVTFSGTTGGVVGDLYDFRVYKGGHVEASNGSAAAPSFSFTSDANTGMFQAASDVLAFSTGGSERMRIDASGNVGIGTTPSHKLDVNGDIALQGNLYGNGKNALQTSDAWLRLNNSNNFTSGVYTPGLLRADGGLQVGASGANVNLQSNGNITASGVLTIQGTGTNVFSGDITSSGTITGSLSDPNGVGDNLLRNGNFESGTANWTVKTGTPGSVVATTAPPVGTEAYQKSAGTTYILSNDYIPVDVNKTYQLEGWAHETTDEGKGFYLGLAYYDATKTQINASNCTSYAYIAASNYQLDSSWRYFAGEVGNGEQSSSPYSCPAGNQGSTTGKPGTVSYSQFIPGTRYVRVVAILNYNAATTSTQEVTGIKFTSVGTQHVNTLIAPDADNSYSLGTPSYRWGNLQVGTGASAFGGNVTISGTLNANATGKTAISIADSGSQSSGITIGGDTNIYRSAANTLKTDDALTVSGTTTLGGNLNLAGAYNGVVLNKYGEDSNGAGIAIGAGGTTILGSGESAGTAAGNIAYGLENLDLTSDNSMTFYTNLQSGWASRVQAMTIASAGQIGISSSTTNGLLNIGTGTTTASGGLYFGTDVNLYRSGSNALKTDDNFTVASNLSVTGTIGFTNTGNANQAITLNEVVTSSVNAGDVVVIDTGNPGQVTDATTANSTQVFGIATTTNVGTNVAQPIAVAGVYQVNVTGTVNPGNYLVTTTTAGVATASLAPTGGVIGQALSTNSGGKAWVLINPGSAGSNSLGTNGTTSVYESNVINDATRAAALQSGGQGDGMDPLDSSTGVWESTTNLNLNGGFESGVGGYSTDSTTLISQSSVASKFGSDSMKMTVNGSPSSAYAYVTSGITASANTSYTSSVWVYPTYSGRNGQLVLSFRDNTLGTTYCNNSSGAVSLQAYVWQKLTFTSSCANASTAKVLPLLYMDNGNPAPTGEVLYADGWQIEQKAYATPYVETNGVTATRNASRIQAPTSLLSSGQGWFAERIRAGVAATSGSNLSIVGWKDSTNSNGLSIYYDYATKTWKMRVLSGGTPTDATSAVQSFNSGDYLTVVGYWKGTQIGVSVNGGAFVTTNLTLPTFTGLQSFFEIGSQGINTSQLDGDIMWAASGTGTLVDADASALNAYGNSDPSLGGLSTLNAGAATPTMAWAAEDAYINQGGSGSGLQGGAGSYIQNTTSLQTGNINLQSGNTGAPAGIFRGATGQTANIFEIQDASANKLFTVDPNGNVTVSGNLNVGGTIGFSGTGNSNQGLTINENITGSVTAGDVVVIDTSNAGYVKDSSSANSTQVVGIATKTQTGGSEPIVISGVYQVNVGTNTPNIGDYLVTDSNTGEATGTTSPSGGIVGQVMSTATSNKVWALIKPASGAGGSGGSSNNYGLMESDFTDTGATVPGPIGFAQTATIGNYIYIFGGANASGVQNTIFRAPVTNPTSWTNMSLPANGSHTLPGSGVYASSLAIIGNTIYLFGGSNSAYTNAIYSASTSDPLTWTSAGTIAPATNGIGYSQLAVIGNYVYLFGGYASTGNIANIYSAPISSPTTWTDTGKTLPGTLYGSSLAIVGNFVYLFGGYSGSSSQNTIFRASTSDPTTWKNMSLSANGSHTLPGGNALHYSNLAIVGSYIYLISGGNTSAYQNVIWSAPVIDPLHWSDTGQILPNGPDAGSAVDIVGNALYLFGGYDAPYVANIVSAPIVNGSPDVSANPSWKVDSNYSSGGGSGTSSQTSNTNTEIDYAERNSLLSTTNTNCTSSSVIFLSTNSDTYDGHTKVRVEVSVPDIFNSSTTPYDDLWLYDNGTMQGLIVRAQNAGPGQGISEYGSVEITPSAGAHTFTARACTSSGTANYGAGSYGGGSWVPAYIRITLANPQLQGGAGIQNGTTVQTGNFNLQSSSQTSVTGILKGATSQSADVFEVQDANSNNLFNVGPSGNVSVSGNLSVGGTIGFTSSGNSTQGITLNMKVTSAVTAGDVVVIDTSNAGQVTDSTSANSTKVFGIATQTKTAGQYQPIVISGLYQVNVGANTVNIGDYLVTDGNTGEAQASSSPVGGIVGQSTSTASSSKVWALIKPASGTGGSSGSGLTTIYDTTLSSDTSSFDIPNIPGTYNQLKVAVYGRTSSSSQYDQIALRFNGDSTADYDFQKVEGNNTATAVAANVGMTSASIGWLPGSNASNNSLAAGSSDVTIINYSGTSFHKSFTASNSSNVAYSASFLDESTWSDTWTSTAAINRVQVISMNGTNFKAGSRVIVYGIGGSSAGSLSGGTSIVGVQTYTSGSGTFTLPSNVTSLQVELVGGGGSGDNRSAGNGGGGGGGGGYVRKFIASPSSTYAYSVGAGGPGGGTASSGGNTTFGALTAGGGSTNGTSGTGAAGGTASGGDVNVPGGHGTDVVDNDPNLINQGMGGGSVLGHGGYRQSAGGNYGGGGGGSTGAGTNNGAGAGGVVIITEYGTSLQGGSGIQNGTTLQTNANFNIQSADPGSVTATIHGTASQSADILDVQNSDNINLLSVDPNGNTFVAGNLNVGGTIGFSNIGNQNQGITLNMVVTSAVNAGDVVVVDTTAAGQVTQSTTANSTKVFGVATQTQSSGVSQPIIVSGIYQVNVDTAQVNIGDYLVTSSTLGMATSSSSPSGGVIGQALSYKAAGSNGTVWARINPGNGSGGSGSGANYGLMESDITSTGTLPAGFGQSSVATIGNTIYAFGGSNSFASTYVNTIYSASVNNPNSWSSAGTIAPATNGLAQSQLAIIGNTIYLFGGITNSGYSNAIYSASVSNPTSWTLAGSIGPAAQGWASSQLAIIGSNIYMFGGLTSGGASAVIISAPISNPLSWSGVGNIVNSGTTLFGSQLAVIGNYVYLFGGYGSGGYTSNIYRAPISNPTNWTYTGFNAVAMTGSQLLIVGNYIYMFGGQVSGTPTTNMYRAPINNPLSWTTVTGGNLGAPTTYANTFIAGNAAYIMGGFNSSNTATAAMTGIYSAPIYNGGPDLSSNPSWKVDSNYSSGGGSGTSSQTANTNTELVYSELTTNSVNIGTTGTTLVTANPITTDGNTYINIQFFGYSFCTGANNISLEVGLQDGATGLGAMGLYSAASTTGCFSVNLNREIKPSAGSHTYSIWALVSGSNGTLYSGPGGTGQQDPSFIRITLANPQLQGGSGINNGTTTQTANFNIQSASGNNPTAVIQGASSQSADILDVRNSSSTNLLSVDASGNLSVAGSIGFSSSGNSSQIMTVNEPVTTTVNQYDVVVIDTNNAGQVTTTTLANSTKVFGVATQTKGTTNQTEPIAISGIYKVNVDTAAVNVGDYLVTSGTAGLATDSSSPGGGVIGQAMSAKTAGSNGTVWVRLNPGNGAGGSSSGAGYGLMESDFTQTGTLAGQISDSQVVTVGNNLYMLGGNNNGTITNHIYTATTSNPNSWTDTGNTIPQAIGGAVYAIVGNNIYIYGGINTSGAPVSTAWWAPLSGIANTASWNTVNNTLPTVDAQAQLAIIGSNIYIFGGYTGSVSKVIYSAPISNPLSWSSNAGSTLPGNLRFSQTAVIGNYVYLFGGDDGVGPSNVIYRAPISNPLNWSNTNVTLNAKQYYSQLAVVGNYVYLFGGNDSTGATTKIVQRAPISDPVYGWTSAFNLPIATGGSSAMIVGNALYIFGGNNGSFLNSIYSAPIVNGGPDLSSNPSWKVDSNVSSGGGSGTSSQTSGTTKTELAYTTLSSSVTIPFANNSDASSMVALSSGALTFDGHTTIRFEAYVPALQNGSNGYQPLAFGSMDNTTSLMPLGVTSVGSNSTVVFGRWYGSTEITPSAGSHTFYIRAEMNSASANTNGALVADSGTPGNSYGPAWIKISLVNPPIQGGSYGIQNSTTTQTGNFNLQSANGNNPTAVIQGASSQSADILDVKNASGSILFNVAPNGYVGVGVSSPQAYLDVNSSIKVGAGGNSYIKFYGGSDGASSSSIYLYNPSGVLTTKITDGTYPSYLSGNVGINLPTANTPSQALQIVGGVKISPTGDYNDGIKLYNSQSNNAVGIIQNVWDEGGSILYKDLALNPLGGNVGIGMTGATEKLQIYNSSAATTGVLVTNATTGSEGARFGIEGSGRMVIQAGYNSAVNDLIWQNSWGSANVSVAGSLTTNATPDLAETISTASDVQPYDVVSADPDNSEAVVKSSKTYDSTAVGVISDGSSSFMVNSYGNDPNHKLTNPQPLVLAGRVQVKISDENGPVEPGDYLTSASTPGYAMKATRAGATIGKALGFFGGSDTTNPATGTAAVNGKTYNTGKVMTLVNVSYYDPISAMLQGDIQDVTNTVVAGNLEVDGNSVFKGNIAVEGHIVGNADTSGTITVTSGQNNATHSFDTQYTAIPKVIITPDDDTGSLHWWVTKSNSDFTVHLSSSAPNSLDFDYMIQQSGP